MRAGQAQSLQAITSLDGLKALWTGGWRGPLAFATDVDGRGTKALRWDWSAAPYDPGPTEGDGVVEYPYPAGVGGATGATFYTQFKVLLGRTSTGGGVGAINDWDPNMFGKRALWLTPADNYVSRIYMDWHDGFGFRSDGRNWVSKWSSYAPQQHPGIVQVFTVQITQPNLVRVWVNGVVVLEDTAADLGTTAYGSFQTPATFSHSDRDCSEYWWDFVSWKE